MTWTATIIKYNDDALTMDVMFNRAGYNPVVVGVMLPAVGADLREHVASYAPWSTWEWEDAKRVQRDSPAIGTQIEAPEPPAAIAETPAPTATLRLEPL